MNELSRVVRKYPCPICHSGEWKTYFYNNTFVTTHCPNHITDSTTTQQKAHEAVWAREIALRIQKEANEYLLTQRHNHKENV
jgi:hypothetical protein